MPSPPNSAAHTDERAVAVHHDAPSCRLGSRVGRRVADAGYIALVTLSWVAGNVLGVLGCAVAVFVVLSHGQWDAFFLHIDNLASRYVAADASRRMTFEHILVQVFMVLFVAITAFRARGFIRRVRSTLAEGGAR